MHSHLTRSKIAKNNEFYTQYADVATEIEHYLQATPELFRDKCVYLPADCALYAHSAFYRYFKANFTRFGLRKLIAVGYNALTDECGAKRGFCYTLETSWTTTTRIFTEQARALEGDGDFRSEECRPFWQEADFIITNPPFSILTHFTELLVAYNKRYLFIGPVTAMTYKRLFQQILLQHTWFGGGKPKYFIDPSGQKQPVNCLWYTNLYHEVPNKPLPTLRTMAENKALYSSRYEAKSDELRVTSENTHVNNDNAASPAIRNSSFVIRNSESATLYKPYDNYEAIEVPRIEYIPSDYYGRMGVPITILPYIIHPQKTREAAPKGAVTSDELRVTSANAASPAIRHSSFEIRNSESATLNLAEVSEFGYVHSRAVRINDKRDRQYRGAVIDGKMCFSRVVIQHIDSLQEEANQKSKIKNQKSKIKNQKSNTELLDSSCNIPNSRDIKKSRYHKNRYPFRIVGKLDDTERSKLRVTSENTQNVGARRASPVNNRYVCGMPRPRNR